MRKIYTRTGDKGTTAIAGGERVEKDDIRIEANGTIDELNSIIGILRSMIPSDHLWQPLLYKIQFELMNIMGCVATPSDKRNDDNSTVAEMIILFEETMDNMTKELYDNEYFILPGGTKTSAIIQLARTFTRRAERRLWTLNKIDPIPEQVLMFFNRLSDLFFVMAKQELQQSDISEEHWKKFSYRRKQK